MRSGGYRRLFGIEGVRIAYATTGVRVEEGQARRKAMCEWTKDGLKDGTGKLGASFAVLYGVVWGSLREEQVWYRPDAEKPMKLFEG